MAEGKTSEQDTATPKNSTGQPNAGASLSTPAPDRSELVSRARVFLQSPQIMHQDALEKRRFLTEKGLNEMEIEGLLREVPIQRPLVPPRSYPPLPPSTLPTLLLGLTRIFSWIAGGSAVLIFVYYRLLLPRITRTTTARRSIKLHHLSLLRRLNDSLKSLRSTQADTHALLPQPEPFNEAPNFLACHSVADILEVLGGEGPGFSSIPPVTLVRCGIQGFGKGKDGDFTNPTTEELFQYLEGQLPWLVTEDGVKYEQKLWETLSTCSIFTGIPSSTENFEEQKPTRWAYSAPTPQEPSPVLKSLHALSAIMPKDSSSKHSARQHTLQALSDFTGYISTQVYMPYGSTSGSGFLGTGGGLGPAEDEFRREIRALKGLVLNRRSFMPAIPHSESITT